VANQVLGENSVNYGYDARLDRYCDMVKERHHRPDQGGPQRAAERGERGHAAADQ